MRETAIKTRDADLDDSIIGLDCEGTKQGISIDGYYVNKFDR